MQDMALLKIFAVLTVFVGVIIAAFLFTGRLTATPVPAEYRLDHYWGKKVWKLGDALPKDNDAIKPFKINVDKSVLDDLIMRLKGVRLQDSFEGTNFEYGMRSDVLKEFIDYWVNSYDWKKQETYLNSFPQFKTQVEGLDIHFVHIKSSSAKAIPLMLVHGWPGSYIELLKVVPKLKDKFELIIPSLPGYGFSESSSKSGLSSFHIGRIFVKLMNRLGHKKFMYHGGDWGALIGRSLARTFPEKVIGFHTTMPTGPFSRTGIMRILLSEFGLSSLVFESPQEAQRWNPIKNTLAFGVREGGYLLIQATKPDTVGVALNNDPAGLAAYILEKFSVATKKENVFKADGGLGETFTKDELLTNVMIYWINSCFTSSARLYKEGLISLITDQAVVTVPTVALVARTEVPTILTPTLMKDAYSDLLKYTQLDKYGHFLSFEAPDVVAKDIIEFAEILRARENSNAKRK